jgi:hypothetical protein
LVTYHFEKFVVVYFAAFIDINQLEIVFQLAQVSLAEI